VKLALKVTLAFVLSILTVQSTFGVLRIRREVNAFLQDSARDQQIIGRALALTAAKVWQTQGAPEASALVEHANTEYGRLHIHWQPPSAIPASLPGEPVPLPVAPAGIVTWMDSTGENRDVFTVVPVTVGEATVGAITLTETLAEEGAYVRESVVRLAWSTAAMLALSGTATLLIGLFLVGRPVHALVYAARKAGEGDLSSRIDTGQHDEIGELAAEFNRMFDKLEEARSHLRQESAARIAALEQLRHADRLMTVGQLASGIAHELGTPLNVVSGRAKMIASDPTATETTTKNARIVAEQAERMAGIIRQLLDFARQRGPYRASVHLRSLVEDTVDLLRPMAKKRNVTVHRSAPPEDITAFVDAGQIQQALTNVIVNGIQAMNAGGNLHVDVLVERRLSPQAEERAVVCLRVRDEGIGIPPASLPHVFDPFFTTKEVGHGTGLGLSVTHGILREHGGWIDVESAVDKGTTFWLCIPWEPTK
jgi:signal transduction histidine kinase